MIEKSHLVRFLTFAFGVTAALSLASAHAETLEITGTRKLHGGEFSTTAHAYTITKGAVLNLDGNTGVAPGTTILSGTGTLNGSGKLNLATGVSETVSTLVIDGKQRPSGTWNATTDPDHFTGSDSLIVTPDPTAGK